MKSTTLIFLSLFSVSAMAEQYDKSFVHVVVADKEITLFNAKTNAAFGLTGKTLYQNMSVSHSVAKGKRELILTEKTNGTEIIFNLPVGSGAVPSGYDMIVKDKTTKKDIWIKTYIEVKEKVKLASTNKASRSESCDAGPCSEYTYGYNPASGTMENYYGHNSSCQGSREISWTDKSIKDSISVNLIAKFPSKKDPKVMEDMKLITIEATNIHSSVKSNETVGSCFR